MSVKLAIFASGGGSNAKKIVQYFQGNALVDCVLLCTNNPASGVVDFGKSHNIEVRLLSKTEYQSTEALQDILASFHIDLIVLAGYLKLVPAGLVQLYDTRIVNIHPALLPSFGGPGMYGMNIHKAVIEAGEKQSGLTIHYVNEKYDEGQVIFQKAIDIPPGWTPQKLQKEILRLEHYHFPIEIEKLAKKIHSDRI